MSKSTPYSPDATDLRILQLLQKNSAITQKELAAQTHISPATALRRIERLRQQGIIEREVAILNPEHLGHYLQVIAEVTLDRQDTSAQDAFETMVNTVDAVQQCYRVNAGPDFILIITVTDIQAYQQLARAIFSPQHNIRNIRAFFCSQRSKFTTEIPLPPNI